MCARNCQHGVCYVSYRGGVCGGGGGRGGVRLCEGCGFKRKRANKKPVKRKQQKDEKTQKNALIDTTFSSFSLRFLVTSV